MPRVLRFAGAFTLLLALFVLTTGSLKASGTTPASSQTLAVGPYIIDFTLDQNPPTVDTPLEVTVVLHDRHLRLQGTVTAEPGLGTDATPLRFDLAASNGILIGTIHMPVRGAWNLVITLSGPLGTNTTQVAVIVAAPGAIPIWLGWLIGASPLCLVVFWIWRQHRYRRILKRSYFKDDFV
ncbi:hypothetical protein ccbrp13_15640 [Ktedonobacteria bacterium brp13]|nr:hypothetical protein ccbrp13_15640 [Ktedonobacteria bacterium brp13]